MPFFQISKPRSNTITGPAFFIRIQQAQQCQIPSPYEEMVADLSKRTRVKDDISYAPHLVICAIRPKSCLFTWDSSLIVCSYDILGLQGMFWERIMLTKNPWTIKGEILHQRRMLWVSSYIYTSNPAAAIKLHHASFIIHLDVRPLSTSRTPLLQPRRRPQGAAPSSPLLPPPSRSPWWVVTALGPSLCDLIWVIVGYGSAD